MRTATDNPAANRNRLYLLFIIALFGIPLLLAWLLVERWHPDGTVNHGELLNPAQPVPHFRLQQADGTVLDEAFLHGRWTLAYQAADGCGERCRQGLYNIRQVRLALGKDMTRAQTLLMLDAPPDPALQSWLAEEHAEMTTGVADVQTRDFFTGAFADPVVQTGWVYLIDPLGNLFMRYRVEDDPKGMLEDLKRLFKYSKIG